MAKKHFIEDDSKRPNICFIGVNFSFENFWSHVDWRPEHGLSYILWGVQVLAKTKVTKFNDTVMEENIIGFQVPMHDIVFVQNLKSIDQLLKN